MSLLPFGDLPPFQPRRFVPSNAVSLELLGSEFLESFYASEGARRARRDHLEGMLKTPAWVALARNEWEHL